MTVELKTLAAWDETRATLVDDLALSMGVLAASPWSQDPASPYVLAQAEDARIVAALRRHAVLGLKLIDASLADGALVAQIETLSAAAQHEAERIASVTHTIQDIAKAVDMVTDVVEKFAALPFVS